jgi:hypothetical protein
MALSFPLSFAAFMALIGLEDGMFSLSRNDQVSGLPNAPLNAELASPLWRFDGTTGPIPNDDAESIAALFEMLEAPGRDFYIANPRKIGPRMDKSGAVLGSASPTIHTLASSNRELRITGLPSGYVLSRGDMIAFDYGPSGQKRRAIHRLAGDATASSGGLTPLVELSTFIRAGAAVGDPVYLAPATMRAKLIPGTYKPQQSGPLHQRFTFSAIQKLI